ncbi:uncharacterized protein HD556DRAFT_1420932 [Suillus plorans]|uniref:Uncharacterized protein n=1 Tax=Suillus plorans TaxID=116603 RepID=A0A9P7AAP7_9AGAM|nr:uncharacterized protein HD556DRAFT_1420932 [Suillus plorans]KAG1785620.1 hypothetical protein HD556DRAFT_1420932 [Suillus plorans]
MYNGMRPLYARRNERSLCNQQSSPRLTRLTHGILYANIALVCLHPAIVGDRRRDPVSCLGNILFQSLHRVSCLWLLYLYGLLPFVSRTSCSRLLDHPQLVSFGLGRQTPRGASLLQELGFADRRQISTGLTVRCTCIKDTLPVSKFPSDPITHYDAAVQRREITFIVSRSLHNAHRFMDHVEAMSSI